MSTSIRLLLATLFLVACPKPSPTGSSAEESIWIAPEAEPQRRVPDGWSHVDLPTGVSDLNPTTSLATEDGSLWIGGSAVKIGQHQWLLRAPGLEAPVQHIYDPGRILHLASNGTGGVAAVGALGGIPSDKAWFGSIDAFGEPASRQTYLSTGAGRLQGIDASGENLVLAGTATQGLHTAGWLITADRDGSDKWKRTYGDSGERGLGWVSAQSDGIVGLGYSRTAEGTDEAWYLRTSPDGELEIEQQWASKSWTRLSTGVAHPSGDVLGAGLTSAHQFGADDGEASLWIGRINSMGVPTWDRSEREDVSEISSAVAWGDGLALVARTGGIGTADRRTWLVRADGAGAVQWTELNVPVEIDFAEVHAITEDTLQFVAVIADDLGVSWTSYPLVLKD